MVQDMLMGIVKKGSSCILACCMMLMVVLPPSCQAVEQTFYDVDVFIIGRCRTRFHFDNEWADRLKIGHLLLAGAVVNESGETWLFVRIQDGSSIVFKEIITNASISAEECDGIFFWSTKGNGVSAFAPFMFIRCHAEFVRIRYLS